MVSTTNLIKMENDPKKTLTIEVCVDTVESAIAAQRGGADRIELCGNLIEGGITPSIGAIEMVRKNLSIPLHVVIRPRGGDFLYSDIDFEVMKRDIELVKWLGADGVVFGVLTPRGAVDVERTEDLIARARPLSVTFHRAFDMTRDPYQSLDDLITLGVNRVLTSGQEGSIVEGLAVVAQLAKRAGSRITVMAGGGLTEQNIGAVVSCSGVREVHFTARTSVKSRMSFRNPRVVMGSPLQPVEYLRLVADTEKIKRMREEAQSAMAPLE